ncbi:RHS repeat-associated core domain-containing protein [Elongatibacter sediminis]|uniref:RHS repeat-associated core domain-containing protein n=1 Tax=Elongatibacter sediminis TaxID=3119006 RepID=A0AAW9RGY7_9GAMM
MRNNRFNRPGVIFHHLFTGVVGVLGLCGIPQLQAGVQGEPGLHMGGWNDSVVIEVPAGIAGVAPTLSIEHNHGHRDGLMGSNYQLSGLSVITRRSATGGVPELGSDDTESSFYLDGELLIRQEQNLLKPQAATAHQMMLNPGRVGIDSAHWQPGIYYEPETYTGALLEYDSERNLWIMRRNGWLWEYGQQDGAGREATVIRELAVTTSGDSAVGNVTAVLLCEDASALCSTVAWHLSRAVDPYGNEIIYNYQLLPLTHKLQAQYEDVQIRWPVIESIHYAGQRQSVTFDYEYRPDPRLDASGGVPAILSHRLSKIQSWVDDLLYSDYHLSYQDDRPDNPELPNSVLWKVERKAADGNVYRDIRVLEVDTEQAGWPDITAAEPLQVVANPGSDSASVRHLVFPQGANLNDDGVTDLVVLAWHCSGLLCSNFHRVYLAKPEDEARFVGVDQATGDDLDLIQAWNDELNTHLDGAFVRHGRGYLLADLDNDYRLDLLVESSDADEEELGDISLVSHRGGDRFVTRAIPELDACKIRYGQLGDVDGDGYQDLIRVVHEQTDLCPRANKTRWVANSRHAPHFDWAEKKQLAMPLDQESLPDGWTKIIGTSTASTPNFHAATLEPRATEIEIDNITLNRLPIAACRGEFIGPPENFSEFDSEPANLSKFARFGDFNSDGVLDVLYSMHGCYTWSGQTANDAVSYWYPIEESLYSEVHYGLGDGSFIASGIHAGHPLLEYSEGWAIPNSGGDDDGPDIVIDPDLDLDLEPGIILGSGDTFTQTRPGKLSGNVTFMKRATSSSGGNNSSPISARSSSSGWLIQNWYQHRLSPFNPDRGHYSALMLQLDTRFAEPAVLAYDRGLSDGYFLSNDERLPADLEILPTRSIGDHQAFGDFDGDGFVDLLTISVISTQSYPGTQAWSTKLALNTKQSSRGRTLSSTGPFGGKQQLAWGFSAEGLHANPDLPLNLEVLNESEGAHGRRAYRYAEGVASYGKFRGFAHAELLNERGGRTIHGYYTEPARIGLQKYGARLRTDGSLQHVTVSLFGNRNDSGGYSYNLAPPYFSPLIRKCEYQLGAADANGNQTQSLDQLVTRCHDYSPDEGLGKGFTLAPEIFDIWLVEKPFHQWSNSVPIEQPLDDKPPRLMVRDRPGDKNTPSAVKRQVHRATINRMRSMSFKQAQEAKPLRVESANISDYVISGQVDRPLLETQWQKSLQQRWQRNPADFRWKPPENIPLPIVPQQPGRAHEGDTELVEFITDYFYDHAARRLDSEYEYQDTSLLSDDRISEYGWEKVGAGFWYRLSEVLVSDHQGNRFGRLKRSDFDPAGFNNAQTVLRCGIDDHSCYQERYAWDEHGRLVSTTANDGGQAGWEYDDICGAVEHIDPVGRSRYHQYDGLCRKQGEQWLTSSSTFAYDGFNRLYRTDFSAGGNTPDSTIYTLQDDELAIIADSEFREPRMARLRSDGQLELTYLDEFGRLTRKLLCRNDGEPHPQHIDDVFCEPGTELVTEWQAWSHDGYRIAQAQPYFNDEIVRVSTYHHDELGDVFAAQHPAHTPLQDGPQWLTTWFSSGPGWESKTDALGRVFRTEFTTLRKSETVDGLPQTSETVDAFGRFITIEQPGGVTERFSYDSYNRLASREYAQAFECWTFNGQSYVSSQTCTARQEFGYDANGRQNLVRFADGSEQITRFDYSGRPIAQTASGNGASQVLKQWQYHDSEVVPRITITDENLNQREQLAGTLGQITEETVAGLSIQRDYGIHGKPLQIVDENGVITSFEYDLYDRLSRKTIGGIEQTDYQYNGRNHLTRETDADGVVQTWEYTYSGKPAAHYLGGWLIEASIYDEGGRKTGVYDDGVWGRRSHDRFDMLLRVESGLSSLNATDPLTVFTYDYDSGHRLVARTAWPVEGQQAVVLYGYNAIGLLERITDADGEQYQRAYDSNLNVHRSTDPEGYSAVTTYDWRGRVTSQDIPGGGKLQYQYASAVEWPDRDDRLYAITVSDGEQSATTRYLDAWEQTVVVEYPDGSQMQQDYTGTLLAARRMKDASGQTLSETRYAYHDNVSRLAQIAGPDSPAAFTVGDNLYAVDYSYTNAGRLSLLESPVEAIAYDYDDDGLLAQETYPEQSITFYREAAYPDVTRQDLEAGGQLRQTFYSRNTNGQIVKQQIMTNGDVETRQFYRFNAYGRPARTISQHNGRAQVRHDWAYTNTGQLASRETFLQGRSIGTVKWLYYGNGVVQAVQDTAGNRIAYRYGNPFDYRLLAVDDDIGHTYASIKQHNGRDQVTGLVLADDTEVRFTYDLSGRQTRRIDQYTDGNQTEVRNDFDALGRLVHEYWQAGGQEVATDYEYDGKGRLQREDKSNPELSIHYEWDLAGNLLTKQIEHSGSMNQHFAATITNNRLVAANGEDLKYDAFGNVRLDQYGRQFDRLPSGLIRAVATPENRLRFFRDSDGISWAAIQSRQRKPMIDLWRQDYSQLPLASLGADGSHRLFVSDDGGFVYEVIRQGAAGSNSEAAVYDQQDSLRRRAGGNLPARDAFGEPLDKALSHDPDISDFTFHGMASYAATTGMHFSRYRGYDPASGRFLSRDPAGLRGGFNRYGYVHGDPVNLSDPMGLFAISASDYGSSGGNSFVPPNTQPGGWPTGDDSDAPFGDPGWGNDGCPVTAMCATDDSNASGEESGGSSVDASDSEGASATEPGSSDPTTSNPADLDGYRWDTEIFYEPSDGFVSWREGDGQLQTADVKSVEHFAEGTQINLEDNPSGATSLFIMDGETPEDTPSSAQLGDGTDVEFGSELEVSFGERGQILGDLIGQKWSGFTDSLWATADAAMNPVDTWMNNTPGGLALQGDWSGAGWSMLNTATMPYQIAGGMVMTGGRAVVGTFTSPYHINRVMFSNDPAQIRYSANQFVDNQIASVETVSMITPAGAGRKILTKGVLKNIPKRPKKIGRCSFAENTPIYTEAGLRRIQDVYAGDLLASTPATPIDIEYREVLESYTRDSSEHLLIQFTDLNQQVAGSLAITNEHPVWIRNRGWVEARDIVRGDGVITIFGTWLTVSSIENVKEQTPVFNVAVENTENYFAGEAGVLVHNCHHIRNDGITPGPYAVNPTPLRQGSHRRWTAAEKRAINKEGYENGCHTCGRKDPGGFKNFVVDEHPRMSSNNGVYPREGYPQCKNCMREQALNAAEDARWDADAFKDWDK